MTSHNNNLRELPKGWAWTSLEQIAGRLQSGGTPSTKVKEYYEDGKVPFVKIEDMVNCQKYLINTEVNISESGLRNSSAWMVPKFSLLYSMYASYGVPVINKIEVATSQAIINFVPPNDSVYVDYLYYYLLSIKPFLKKYIRGTTQENLNGKIVRNLPIPLSATKEQKRIVAKIEELFTKLDAGVQALKKVKAELKRYRQAVLKHAFEGKLTADWRKKNKDKLEPASKLLERIAKEREKTAKVKAKKLPPLDKSNLPELPDGWERARLEAIANIASGQTPKELPNITSRGQIPFYKVGDMNRSGNEVYMKEAEIYLDTEQVAQLRLHIREKDTVIFPKRGGAIKTNKKRILTVPSAYDLNTMSVLLYLMPNKFFYYWISSIDLSSLSDGSNVPQINHKDIEPLSMPVPPVQEQYAIIEEIERHFSIADEVEQIADKALKQSQRLRQSILKKAFEGKLVPQDPADEPADKLLERIKTEKVKLQAKQKIRNITGQTVEYETF